MILIVAFASFFAGCIFQKKFRCLRRFYYIVRNSVAGVTQYSRLNIITTNRKKAERIKNELDPKGRRRYAGCEKIKGNKIFYYDIYNQRG